MLAVPSSRSRMHLPGLKVVAAALSTLSIMAYPVHEFRFLTKSDSGMLFFSRLSSEIDFRLV